MKPRKKDNLTDAVEALQTHRDDDSAPQPKDQQVLDNEGEIITLGQDKPTPPNKNRVVELSDKDLSEIKEIISAAVQSSLDRFLKKFEQRQEK